MPSRMTPSIRASVARSGGVAAAAGDAITADEKQRGNGPEHPAHSTAGTRLGHESPAAGFGLTALASAALGADSWPPMSRRKGG